jgi:hypothetical protein
MAFHLQKPIGIVAALASVAAGTLVFGGQDDAAWARGSQALQLRFCHQVRMPRHGPRRWLYVHGISCTRGRRIAGAAARNRATKGFRCHATRARGQCVKVSGSAWLMYDADLTRLRRPI